MKTIKFLCISFFFVLFSCNSNDENFSEDVTKSRASRIYLNAVKESMHSSNLNSNSTSSFCFTPVFPIEVMYSNGRKVSMNSIEGLKDALRSESKALHINRIIYPFQVQSDLNLEVFEINNELQFEALLFSCESINSIDHYFSSLTCFEFIFPLSVKKNNGDVLFFPNYESMQAELNSLTQNDYWVDFIYPFKIKYGDSEALIQDIWDFYDYVDCTPEFGCICTLEYNPVCVQTSNGILHFDNSCWAVCAGYSSDDFIDCNESDCECTEEFMPVCVQTPNGILQFTNSCWASCAGYTSEDFVSCD